MSCRFLSGPLQADSRPVFNLYGCVCHFGSVGGGHYTAYSRHLATGSWNYFDDGSISEGKVPGESPGDHSSAYILFYQRAGKFTLFVTISCPHLVLNLYGEKNIFFRVSSIRRKKVYLTCNPGSNQVESEITSK
jgi:hypothetical protein